MNIVFQQKHIEIRQARKAFMLEMIKEGNVVIEELKTLNPVLYHAIQDRFKSQTARAAFWLVCERDQQTLTTPLQKLEKGQDSDFIAQLGSSGVRRLE